MSDNREIPSFTAYGREWKGLLYPGHWGEVDVEDFIFASERGAWVARRDAADAACWWKSKEE